MESFIYDVNNSNVNAKVFLNHFISSNEVRNTLYRFISLFTFLEGHRWFFQQRQKSERVKKTKYFERCKFEK